MVSLIVVKLVTVQMLHVFMGVTNRSTTNHWNDWTGSLKIVVTIVQPDLRDCSCMHVTAILLMCLCTDVCLFCQCREKHREDYSGFEGTKKGEPNSGNQPKLTEMSTCHTVQKFERNSPKQREILEAMVKMIVKDIRPISIVENEGFRT